MSATAQFQTVCPHCHCGLCFGEALAEGTRFQCPGCRSTITHTTKRSKVPLGTNNPQTRFPNKVAPSSKPSARPTRGPLFHRYLAAFALALAIIASVVTLAIRLNRTKQDPRGPVVAGDSPKDVTPPSANPKAPVVASDSPKDPASQEPVEIWIVDEQAAKEKRNKTIVLNLAKKMEDPPVLENPPPVDETNNEAPDPGAFSREEEERLRVMRWQHQEEIRKTVGRRRERRARQNQLRSLIQGGR